MRDDNSSKKKKNYFFDLSSNAFGRRGKNPHCLALSWLNTANLWFKGRSIKVIDFFKMENHTWDYLLAIYWSCGTATSAYFLMI